MLHFALFVAAVSAVNVPDPENIFRSHLGIKMHFKDAMKGAKVEAPVFPTEFVTHYLEFTEDAEYGNHSQIGHYYYSANQNSSRDESIFLYDIQDPRSATGEIYMVVRGEEFYHAYQYEESENSAFQCDRERIHNFSNANPPELEYIKDAIVYPDVRDTLLLSAQWGPRAVNVYYGFSTQYDGYVFIGFDAFQGEPVIEYGDFNGFYFQRVYTDFYDGTPNNEDFAVPSTWDCQNHDETNVETIKKILMKRRAHISNGLFHL